MRVAEDGMKRTMGRGAWLKGALVFAVCAAACFVFGPSDPLSAAGPRRLQAAGVLQQPEPVSLQVQQMLAQGGCSGWIALAGDEQLTAQLDGVQLASSEEHSDGPQFTQLPDPTTTETLRVAAAADDELISKEEDLYFPPKEADQSPPPATSEPSAESSAKPATPAAETPATTTPAPAANSEPQTLPPVEEEKPTDAVGAEDEPAAATQPAATVPTGDLPAPPSAVPPANQTPRAEAPPALDPSLFAPPPVGRPEAKTQAGGDAANKAPEKSRCEFIADSLYPSAKACRACHEQIYDEWAISSHAYAAVSPMFHKFEQTINDLSQGTIGYFCYRCHTPAGTSLGISRAMPIYEAPPVAREGVTCVACHRIAEMYGKTNGERRIEPGPIYTPVFGTLGGDGVATVVSQAEKFKVRTSPHGKTPAQDMHAAGLTMPQLAASEFCASCHQVAVYPGIKLEVVWEQYRASPACKKGVRCQDCHMGRVPGLPLGFDCGPAAVINKKPAYLDRRHSNHVFYGPGYSLAHPGVFPFNPKADRWAMRDWLLFDWRGRWGTEEFERAVKAGVVCVTFPDAWKEADDRMDAREIVEENLKRKRVKDELRARVMENGSNVQGPFFSTPPARGQELKFEYIVTNTNEGHNLPTASLGAQPQLWASVVLVGPDGRRVWESGYLDRNGDLADIHSKEVRNKRLEFDWQLFNLQTMFLITGAKGTDREFPLPINIDFDQLPFIRPAPQPITVLNHPPFIRMEARSLAPLGARRVPYKVPAWAVAQPGRYRLSFRMRSRTEPMYFMRFCKSTPEMQQSMIDGTLDFHESSIEFEVR